MSERRNDQDIERALSEWMRDVAPPQAPTRLLEETFTETMQAGQVHAYPWHRSAVHPGVRTAVGSGTRLAFFILALLLVAATAIGLAGGGLPVTVPPAGPTVPPSPTPLPSIAAVLPSPLAVVPDASVAMDGPIAVVAANKAIWVMAPGRLDRIDPATNTVTASVSLGSTSDLYNGLAANSAGLWASDSDTSLVYLVDPISLRASTQIPAGQSPKGVLATADGVWVADVHGGAVLRIDPATDAVAVTIPVGPTGPSGPNWLASGFGSIWVDVPNAGTIVRIDPVTNRVQSTIKTPTGVTACGGIAITGTAVWVTGCSSTSRMARIDPTSNEVVATIDLGGYGFNPAVINGALWISVDAGRTDNGKLVRIDPATNAIDRVLVPGTTFGGGGDLVAAAGSIWVLDGYNRLVWRLPATAFGP